MTKRNSSEELRSIVAANMRALRKAGNLSQEALADKCGMHRTYIGSVERMERNVSLSTLEVIARVLEVSVPELLSKKGREIHRPTIPKE